MPSGVAPAAWQPEGSPTHKTGPAPAHALLAGSWTHAASGGPPVHESSDSLCGAQDGGDTSTYSPPASHWIDVAPLRHVRYEASSETQVVSMTLRSWQA